LHLEHALLLEDHQFHMEKWLHGKGQQQRHQASRLAQAGCNPNPMVHGLFQRCLTLAAENRKLLEALTVAHVRAQGLCCESLQVIDGDKFRSNATEASTELSSLCEDGDSVESVSSSLLSSATTKFEKRDCVVGSLSIRAIDVGSLSNDDNEDDQTSVDAESGQDHYETQSFCSFKYDEEEATW
jgi:hypothetical protein